MNKVELVLKALKPKVKALGFSKKELESIAADVADNLELEDEASEEDINAAIESGVNAVIPSLKIAQKAINRGIQEYKDAHPVDNDPSKKEKEEEAGKDKTDEPSQNETPDWVKSLMGKIESLTSEVTELKAGKLADTRRETLSKMLEGTGIFGKRVLKSFDKMKFDNDDEFEEFVSDVQGDLESFNQERANEGLAKLGAPASGNKKEDKKAEPISDKELDELAENL